MSCGHGDMCATHLRTQRLAASGQQKSPPQEVIETGSDKCKNMQNESLSSELAIIGIRVSIRISIRIRNRIRVGIKYMTSVAHMKGYVHEVFANVISNKSVQH